MLVVIDADPIVYRCGFASEQTGWHIIYEDDNGPDEIEFWPTEELTAGDQMASWRSGMAGVTILSKERLVKPDPVSYALRATKVQIESIIAECESHFGEPARMLMYISGAGGSYRDKIATVRPYKGNRDPTHKPFHYDAIRDYLRASYNSYVTAGIEADDAVSIFAHQHYERRDPNRLVIATIDKDLDQIPGHHYNYMNKVFYAITEQESERWFVFQILAGDITDNVVGVWKCGESCAARILKQLSFDGVDRAGDRPDQPAQSGNEPALAVSTSATDQNGADPDRQPGESDRASTVGVATAGEGAVAVGGYAAPAGVPDTADGGGHRGQHRQHRRSPDWWPTVVGAYASSRGKRDCPYASREAEAVAIEMAQLVKLQEYPGQLWHPYGDLVVPGFGEENFDG